MKNIKRIIKGKDYQRIIQYYLRNKINTTYFRNWNKGLIQGRNIDEKIFFTYYDLLYIKKLNEEISKKNKL